MAAQRKEIRSKLVAASVIAVLVAVLVLCVRALGLLEPLELGIYDWGLTWRADRLTPQRRIVLVGVTEQDIHRLGHWPLTDDELATLLLRLFEARPAVIGLDIYRDIPVGDGGQRLRQVFEHHANLVAVTKLGDDAAPGVPPPYVAGPATAIGFNDVLVDPDGKIRRGLLFLDDGHTPTPAFPLLLVLRFAASQGIQAVPAPDHPQWLRLGRTTIRPLEENDGGYVGADARGYQYLLDFPARGRDMDSVDVCDVLEGKIAPETFAGKIVIVGAAAESLRDTFSPAVSRAGRTETTMYGLELHGLAVSQLLRLATGEDRAIRPLGPYAGGMLVVLLACCGAAVGIIVTSFSRFAGMVVFGALIMAAISQTALLVDLWLPLVPMLAAWGLSSAITVAGNAYRERAQRGILMRLFKAHVSHSAADYIWEHHHQIMTDGRLMPQGLTATVLFTDIKDFTSVAETMTPETLMGWLNTYMERMNVVIFEHHGMINKYIGDAIMVLFGVPLARGNEAAVRKDARQAVLCALEMGRALEKLNRDFKEQGTPQIRMRIGVQTGPLVAGCLGDAKRMEYTVLGDTVNVASRLESYDKEYAANCCCRVLVGEGTRQCLSEDFTVHHVGTVRLKGKEVGTNVYHVQNTQK